ncbi:carbohydrate kinase family protein [Streptomyces sp. NPDC059688]|uniref:Carbohydrate kinase family protein n=2 Tax=Streptomyces TaxID=1883 RepID=A0ABY6EYR7_9ACTN|nr:MULTISPECIES: carbohydrate kinase family protein [unclassified Streptomyces]OKJ78861.1 ribokinase [Streptomyces sp. CB01883]ROP47580.1 adenosine kinase [Streptomyces sp. PanSC9]UXY39553.1 carbohydrate kinase family protein [Streptomyces sp. HUAS 14-6]
MTDAPTPRGSAPRTLAVTGSIATDHLLTYPGRFVEQFLPGRLDHVSLSFLADTLDVRQGGVGANIAHGLAALGHRPVLVGAAGTDFEPYGRALAAQGVDVSAVHVSETRHTARFICTTDADGNQLATFYPGAMAEADRAGLTEVILARDVDYVLIGADDPAAMLRHTRACRALGVPFAADPAQQLARLDGPAVRELVDGAHHLFTNEYEHDLLLTRTGWSRAQVLDRVGTWVTTLGARGCRIERVTGDGTVVPAVPVAHPVDPTGVGDAFRAGYLAGLSRGRPEADRARLGCAMASLALAAVGTQTYTVGPGVLGAALTRAYGRDAAASADLTGVEAA